MSNTFNTAQNKGFLWNLLFENGAFNEISKNHVAAVRAAFETKIKSIEKQISPEDTLVTLNKRILEEISNELIKYKNEPITSSDVSKHRQKQFSKNVDNKQHEFNKLMNQSKPKEISFSDKLDEPIGTEMDSMVADVLKRREQELNVVLQGQNTDEGDNWINKNKNIKIGDSTDLTEKSVVNIDKRVSFHDNEAFEEAHLRRDDENAFLSKLKSPALPMLPPNQMIDMIKILNNRMQVIEDQQKKIIHLLEQKE